MHLGGAMSRRETGVATVHFAEILASTRQNPLEVSGPVELSIRTPTARRAASSAPAPSVPEGGAR
jgi:L-lactate dehydrogenase complex protein LldE